MSTIGKEKTGKIADARQDGRKLKVFALTCITLMITSKIKLERLIAL
jgi:hypothetical protein